MEIRKLDLKNKNKKSQIAINAVVVTVIVALVLGVLFFFLFKANPNKILKWFPSYEVPESEIIDLSGLTRDQLQSICPVVIGRVGGREGGFWKTDLGAKNYIYFVKDSEGNMARKENYQETSLIWEGDDSAKILIDKAVVATVSGRDIDVRDEYVLNAESYMETYSEKNLNFPSKENMGNLEGSYKIPEGNLICKLNGLDNSKQQNLDLIRERGMSNNLNLLIEDSGNKDDNLIIFWYYEEDVASGFLHPGENNVASVDFSSRAKIIDEGSIMNVTNLYTEGYLDGEDRDFILDLFSRISVLSQDQVSEKIVEFVNSKNAKIVLEGRTLDSVNGNMVNQILYGQDGKILTSEDLMN